MATRAGSVDPGLLLWLQRRRGLAAAELEEALERRSGLLGVSGVSADMRAVLAAADRGEPRAALAIGLYVHRPRAGIAAMAAAMGGLDAIAFTGGVGEGSARIRGDACAGLAFLSVALDPGANQRATLDSDLSSASSPVRVLLISAREDLEIARSARQVLARS